MSEPDAVLLGRWIEFRDAAAFEEITRRYCGLVYSTARRIIGNDTEAQDVAQDCFARLSTADRSAADHLGGWLHRVATNNAISRLRSEQRRKQREAQFARIQQHPQEITWNDLQDVVDAAIDELSPETRTLIVEYFLEKQSQEAIAERQGVSRQAISYRINKGVEEMRHKLSKKGVAIGAGTLETLALSRPADTTPAVLASNLSRLAIVGGDTPSGAASPAFASTARSVANALLRPEAVTVVGILALAIAAIYGLGVYRPRATDAPSATADNGSASSSALETSPDSAVAITGNQPVQSDPGGPRLAQQAAADVGATALNGRIFDQMSGEGVPDALITATEIDGDGSSFTALSNDEGGFSIALPEGRYTVTHAPVSGYFPVVRLRANDTRDVTVSEDGIEGSADFPLSRGGGLRGRIMIGDEPIANTTFELVCSVRPARSPDHVVHTVQGVRSDANGNYAVSGVPVFEEPGFFMLRQISPPRERDASLKESAYVEPGKQTPVDFKFSNYTASIHGRVTTPDGQAVNARFIGADSVYGVAQTRFQGATDSTGSFHIDGLPSAQMHFNFLIEGLPGYRALNLVLQEGQSVDRDVVVYDTTIQCRALNLPANSAFQMFEVYPADYQIPPGTNIPALNERSDVQLIRLPFTTSADIPGLPPGTYSVVAYSSVFPLESVAEEGVDYNKLLKESKEVVQTVELENGSTVSVDLDFATLPNQPGAR